MAKKSSIGWGPSVKSPRMKQYFAQTPTWWRVNRKEKDRCRKGSCEGTQAQLRLLEIVPQAGSDSVRVCFLIHLSFSAELIILCRKVLCPIASGSVVLDFQTRWDTGPCLEKPSLCLGTDFLKLSQFCQTFLMHMSFVLSLANGSRF